MLDRGQSGEEHTEAERILLDDVHDAVVDLIQLIQTYQSKNKICKIMASSLFQQRQAEAEAVINMAMSRLQVSGVGGTGP